MVQLAAIRQVSMNARDLPRAVAFYRDRLGMRHLFDAGPTMSFFDCGGIRLMLAVADRPEFDHPGSILYFAVDDIQAAHETLASRGVAFREAPNLVARLPDREVWMAFLFDSEGNTLAITSELPTR